MLQKEFMEPLGLGREEVATALGLSVREMEAFLEGRFALTNDMAHRLSDLVGTTSQLWLNGQRTLDEWRRRNAP
jgi:addiction module HigA family antidote